MSFAQSPLGSDRFGWLGHFVWITCLAAGVNFGNIFLQNAKAAGAAGTKIVDGFEITVCYFGPPIGFYPRFFAFAGLSIASMALYRRTFPRGILATVGVAAALSSYAYWWLHSYRAFRSFTEYEIPFLNHPEIKQVAYLYQGTWLDIAIAISLVVCLVLLVDRLLSSHRLAA